MSKAPPVKNPLSNLPGYLRVFRTYLGRKFYLVFVLSLLSAVTDGTGILMLLPLLQNIDAASGASPGGAQAHAPKLLTDTLASLGITTTSGVLVLICCIFLTKAMLSFSALAFVGYLKAQLMQQLKLRMFDAYSRMDYLYFSQRDTGYFINLINSQVTGFYSAFGSVIVVFTGVISTLSYTTLALSIAWQFGAMALGVGIVVTWLFRRLNAYVLALSRKSAQEEGRLMKLLIQALYAFKYLTATHKAEYLRSGISGSIQRLTHYQVRQWLAGAFTDSVREPLAVFCIVLIVLVQITLLDQPLTPILVSVLLFYRGLNSILAVQSSWQKALRQLGSVEMIRDEFIAQARHCEPDGQMEAKPLSKSIELRKVCFRYGAHLKNVLQDASLTIPARTTIAVVGASGAGKSTLIDILTLLLKPNSGQVLIDGIASDQIKLSSWRRQIGFVSQETVVFDDTIANNICLWEGDIEAQPELMQRVRNAARRANIDKFIESLPEGYHTNVGDRGIRLSGGQRQRMFIARELFKEPRLLILDEATSALDSESERFIQDSIDDLRGKVTVVIIAHRLSTIRNVDEVLVFDEGQLIERGTYEELRSRRHSKFGAMVSLQSL